MPRTAWIPTLLFALVPLLELVLSLPSALYVDKAAVVHRGMLDALQWSCWIFAAALAAAASLRTRVVRQLDAAPKDSPPWTHWAAVAVCVEFTLVLCFLKFCQYRGSQYDQDTAVIVQRAFNTLHGRWFHTTVYGVNYLSIHFAFVVDLFSPLLLIWRSALPFIILQSLATGAMGLAAYCLAFRTTKSAYAGFLGMLLVYSSPAYAQIGGAAVNDGAFLAPFLLWGLVFWEYDRRILSLAFLTLAAASREIFPISVAALGIYAALRNGRPNKASLRTAAGFFAAAAALIFVESKISGSFANRITVDWFTQFKLYQDFSGGHRAFLFFLAAHPLQTILSMVYPFQRIRPALELILYAGLFPLAAPAAFAAFCFAMVPELLAVGGVHDMILHYPSLVFGLLMFAAAQGMGVVYARLKNLGWEEFLIIPVLLICGLGFRNSAIPLTPGFAAASFFEAPAIPKLIPPNASLWIEEYFAAWAPARSQLKIINAGNSAGFNSEDFTRETFKPEFVTLQAVRLVEGNRDLRPVWLFLANNGYLKFAQAQSLLILRAPDQPHPGGVSPPAALPVLTAEQHAAFDYFPIWLAHKIHGTTDPNPPKLTAEQERLINYCAYLLRKS